MIIIGEKINGSIPSVADAIARRDADFIKQRAVAQTEAGATFIDCCASVPEAQEVETLRWMIDCIQSVTDLPISVDSPSTKVLSEAYKFCNKPGLFNSVSGEGHKMDAIFPIMAENPGWQVIALLSDDTGIPKNAADRLKVFDKIMAKAKEYGISPSRIHIDPLVEMLCTSENGIETNTEVISAVREAYPRSHEPRHDGSGLCDRSAARTGRLLHGVYQRLPRRQIWPGQAGVSRFPFFTAQFPTICAGKISDSFIFSTGGYYYV